MQKQVPIDSDLFTWPAAEPKLKASQCYDCGNVIFPINTSCPKCGGINLKDMDLKTKGTLWTWTSQEYFTKGLNDYKDPEDFKPYFLGYIELPGQVRVESRLLVNDASELKIGMEMEMVIVPFRVESDGTETMIYAFKPV